MTTTVRETRCKHDMIEGQCAICRGLPDIPPLFIEQPPDVPEVYPLAWTPNEDAPLRWLPAEVRQECSNCGAAIYEGKACAWVPELDGVIGRCCKVEGDGL